MCTDISGTNGKVLTRPQKRRRRMQLLAAHTALAIVDDKTQSKSGKSGAGSQNGECYDRLAMVENLVCQIHWQLIGQYVPEHSCDIDVDLFGSGDQDLKKALFSFHASAQTFVPENAETQASGGNVLGNGDGLGIDTTTTYWEPIPAPGSSWTDFAAEQHYCHWRSQSKSMLGGSTSAMREELRTKAAIKLQRWFTSG